MRHLKTFAAGLLLASSAVAVAATAMPSCA